MGQHDTFFLSISRITFSLIPHFDCTLFHLTRIDLFTAEDEKSAALGNISNGKKYRAGKRERKRDLEITYEQAAVFKSSDTACPDCPTYGLHIYSLLAFDPPGYYERILPAPIRESSRNRELRSCRRRPGRLHAVISPLTCLFRAGS